jgi:hypothetical protein
MTPQPASAIKANSNGVGPALVPPEATGKSQITLCPRPFSVTKRVFSRSFALALIFAICSPNNFALFFI